MSGERAGARSRGSPLLAGAAIDPLRRRNPHRCRHAQRHGRPPPRTSGALPRSPADDFEAVVGKKRKRWTKWRARPPPKRKTDLLRIPTRGVLRVGKATLTRTRLRTQRYCSASFEVPNCRSAGQESWFLYQRRGESSDFARVPGRSRHSGIYNCREQTNVSLAAIKDRAVPVRDRSEPHNLRQA
jgi:hypothetical protein